MGGTIGRCCNRIAEGKFVLDGVTYMLSANDKRNKHHVNGGWVGFDKCVWTPHLNKTIVSNT